MCLYAGRLRTRKLSRRSAVRELKEGVKILRDGVGDVEPPFTDPARFLLSDLDSTWDELADEDLMRLYSELYGETLVLDDRSKAVTVH